jgi:hypothetical protein
MYFQMKFNPLVNEYIISNLDVKGVDRTKMNDDVKKWANNHWICKSKKRLESFAEHEIERKINEYTQLIEKTKKRTINDDPCKRS